ncbi:tRNA (guanine-N(1)-)-methyltransferase) [Candidatus Glomeribacter gigasporarum BEG34]|uniref:tRNA (guanine-N(1)-)-methyltransferase n=1 Tax=Candidatus Glomeribacter gigasporarum BEG34 TaxID=1070319 RepID=G2J940_9BURK|nr:tRNA (guanosine(37)-N1)-methyltransferase TrmD [Candidatus Glomeribacter gigasporarum]CCD29287.1 tRNA (guanine-N(1)-)-methyltransferase) [Candidatus Glomeribacter gigasporarum BEG34]
MQLDAITLFPDIFRALTGWGVTGRAAQRQRYHLRTWNPRDFTQDRHRTVDDRPYGGGPGMVMRAPPLAAAIQAAKNAQAASGNVAARVILMSPQGKPLTHADVVQLAAESGWIVVCGRYEAIDQRLIDGAITDEISVGDFVVSGGELPAMMLMDAVIRLLPGALNDAQSAQQDSFSDGLLDCPHYTRPQEYNGMCVPEVLLGGHHARIGQWRRKRALANTQFRRPELIRAARVQGRLTQTDEAWLGQCSGIAPNGEYENALD